MRTVWMAIATASLAIGATSAFAQRTPISSTGRAEHMESIVLRNGMNRQDQMFMQSAAVVNMAEIMLGKLAQQRGGSWGKEFGTDMEREHSIALEEEKALAARKGVALPHDVDMKHQQLYNRLSRLSGDAFDNAYRTAMVNGHGQAATVFANEIEGGRDEMVRDYAVKMLPGVKHHQMLAMNRKTMKNQ